MSTSAARYGITSSSQAPHRVENVSVGVENVPVSGMLVQMVAKHVYLENLGDQVLGRIYPSIGVTTLHIMDGELQHAAFLQPNRAAGPGIRASNRSSAFCKLAAVRYMTCAPVARLNGSSSGMKAS